jgi:serine protease Do
MHTERILRLRTLALLCCALAAGLFGQTAPPHQGGSYLGVRLLDVDADRAKVLNLTEPGGALILSVRENCAADVAGLRAGDVILLYNGESVLGAQQLGRLVMETPPGRKVRLHIWREGKPHDLMVTTSDPPAYLAAAAEPDWPSIVTDVPAPLMVWKNMLLGFEYEPLSAQLAQFFGVRQGALVRSVEAGSPADKSGLKAGDILTRVAGQLISTPRDLGAAIRMDQHGLRPLSVDVTREHKTVSVQISFSER